jgi:acyl-CoA synthetase (NDP forming)
VGTEDRVDHCHSSTLPSVSELPEAPELAGVVVPRSGFAEAVREWLERGTKAIVAMTADFAEVGESGAALQREIVRDVREVGAILLGPNCNGLFDSEHPS